MKKVLVRGPLLSQSGYGVHARQIFQFCESMPNWQVSTQILPWGITPWNISDSDEGGLYKRIMDKSGAMSAKYDLSFQIQLAHEWDPNLATRNVGVTAGVETNLCSSEWSNTHCEKMDLVIVPSEFTKATLEKPAAGSNSTPIVVLPEAYFPNLTQEATSDPLSELPTSKNILIVGTLTSDDANADRKNLVKSISWFLSTFTEKSDVGLIVKTSRGRDTTIDREIVRKLMKQVKKSVKAQGQKPPKLYMLHGPMSRDEMRDLYKSPKLAAFASATRGEGFGLPLLEAAVAGLPIVATNWSAYTEFLRGPSFLKVAYDLQEIPKSRVDGQIFVEKAMWAQPRGGNFTRKLKQSVTENESIRKHAKELSVELTKSHSLETLGQKFQQIVREHLNDLC